MDLMTYALCKGNGGGGGSSDNYFVVTITGTTPDKTESDIVNAYSQGKNIYAIYSNNLYMFTNTDSDGVHFASIKQNTSAISKIRIKGSTMYLSSVATVPTASSSDNGSELIVKNGGWSKQQKKFIVTLTPTALDYSGTMDKTVAEINTAYKAGQEIVFKVMMSATEWIELPVQARYDATYSRYAFMTYIVDGGNNILLQAYTGIADESLSTYSTFIYSLTPVS